MVKCPLYTVLSRASVIVTSALGSYRIVSCSFSFAES